MSQVEIPILNPLHFVRENPAARTQYKTKYYDDYLFADTLYDFQDEGDYYQEFSEAELIVLQMTADINPLAIYVIDCNGNIVGAGANMPQVRLNKYVPGSALFQLAMSVNTIGSTGGFGKGYFVRMIPAGDPTQSYRTEWFKVSRFADVSDKSILVQYSNSRYHGDVIFETGLVFQLRFPGMIENLEPGSTDKVYQDQVLNTVLLSSKPYENINLWIGGEFGVAPWLIRKLNWALSCDTVFLDGKQYAKTDNSKWTRQTEEGMALSSYVMQLVPGINRASKIINPDVNVNKKITLVYNLGGNVFGSVDSQGGNIVTPVIGLE